MAYENKPQTGSLFPNTKKSESHPDMKGDVYLDKTFLIEMMDKSKGNLVKISLAAWKKESSKGLKYLSMTLSEPYEKPANNNPWE